MDLEKVHKIAFDEQYKSSLETFINYYDKLCEAWDDLIVDCASVDLILSHYLYKHRAILAKYYTVLHRSHDDGTVLSFKLLSQIHQQLSEYWEESEEMRFFYNNDVRKKLRQYEGATDDSFLYNYTIKASKRKVIGNFLWVSWCTLRTVLGTLESLMKVVQPEQDCNSDVESEIVSDVEC